MDISKLKNEVLEIVNTKNDKFIEISDAIWEYAEIRFNLKKSAGALSLALKDEGFIIERPVAGMKDAFIASYGTGSPVIGILGEYDALAGLSQKSGAAPLEPDGCNINGHGCGHNGLGAAGALAACALKEVICKNNLSGTIKFYGCPAEESGSGKAFMARDGHFNGVDAFLTWHPSTENSVDTRNTLANYQIYFKFKGISSHASASPEKGRSALDAAELMNIGVNYLREHITDNARIHYAYIDAGGHAPNVVQSEAKMLYFIRAPKSSQVRHIYDRVVKIAEGAALMTETEPEIIWDSACAEFIPNNILSQMTYKNMQYLGETNYTEKEEELARKICGTISPNLEAGYMEKLESCFPHLSKAELHELYNQPIMKALAPYQHPGRLSFGSTDVGDASWHAPTAQFNLCSYPARTEAHTWQWVSTGKSGIFHKSIIKAAKIISLTAADLLTNPKAVCDAKEELKAVLALEPYHCAIPADVIPL